MHDPDTLKELNHAATMGPCPSDHAEWLYARQLEDDAKMAKANYDKRIQAEIEAGVRDKNGDPIIVFP